MELFKDRINFLGFELGNNYVKLHDHIVKKVHEFPNNYTYNKKELQRFLGIVNYVKNFIPNIGEILGPLYTKVLPKCTTEFNEQDEKLVLQIKRLISNLQPVRLTLANDYRIIEIDVSQDGWGAVLLVLPHEYSSKTEEIPCWYTSGKFKTKTESSFNFEMDIVPNALKAFEIFIPGHKFMLRMDCQVLKYFFNTLNTNKIGIRRLIEFRDSIISRNFKVNIEHIKGSDNILASTLSRYLNSNIDFVDNG